MVYLWRAQQAGTIINILLLGTLTAANLYKLYIKASLHNYGFPDEAELPGLLITMAIIFSAVFGVGYAFDRLKFWKEQNIVGVERNPYGSYKLTAKEVYLFRYWAATLRGVSPLREEDGLAEFFEKWVNRTLTEDQILKSEVEAIDRWVESGDPAIKTVE